MKDLDLFREWGRLLLDRVAPLWINSTSSTNIDIVRYIFVSSILFENVCILKPTFSTEYAHGGAVHRKFIGKENSLFTIVLDDYTLLLD